MFRTYLVLFFSIFNYGLFAQPLTNFTAPANYTRIMELKGDLDKDGVDEIVYVYNTNKPDGQLGFFRVLYICKASAGKLQLWKENATVIRSSKDCGLCFETDITLELSIKNSALVIKQTFFNSSKHSSINRNVFRYQYGNWSLIGSTFTDNYVCGWTYKYDVNFSTKQVSIAETFEDCEEVKVIPKDKLSTFKYPFTAVPKMDGFRPGRVALKVPDSKKFFYY